MSRRRTSAVRSQTPLPAAPGASTDKKRNASRFARWRALSLGLVYLLFAAHIAHWKITGTTLAPLELNEVMYTLELGVVTAGFLFMCVLVLGSLIFGRFFCSWACHIMVLQDLCAWVLIRFRIRQTPIRSRLLLFVPPLTALYMFVWPQIKRAYDARSFPEFHFRTDAEGWASFVTDNFWRNLPGPWIIALTFLVCGFAMVYLLGSRTFCTYICPYGAIFALADRFSPGRIVVSDACEQCGTCTAACTSGIRVHEEVKRHGMIVNPACLKDLDCVGNCPQGALRYTFSKPALFKSYWSGGRFGLAYQFSLVEELLIGVVFLAALLSFRGLYGQIPFLLSLGIGAIVAVVSVATVRLFTRPAVSVSALRLKIGGRLTGTGLVFCAASVLLAGLMVQSAWVRYHEHFGLVKAHAVGEAAALDAAQDAEESDTLKLAAEARDHLLTADRWSLFANARLAQAMVTVGARLGRSDDVAKYATRFLERFPARYPESTSVGLRLGVALASQGEVSVAAKAFGAAIAAVPDSVPAYKNMDRELIDLAGSAGAVDALQKAVQQPPRSSAGHQMLAWVLAFRGQGRAAMAELDLAVETAPPHPALLVELGSRLVDLGAIDAAIGAMQKAVALNPNLPGAHAALGAALAGAGRFDEAIASLNRAIELNPDGADIHYNLGTVLSRMQRFAEAIPHYERALAGDPDDADIRNNLGFALLFVHRASEAEHQLAQAVAIDPNHAGAHFNLFQVLTELGRKEEAAAHLARAAALDPRFARPGA